MASVCLQGFLPSYVPRATVAAAIHRQPVGSWTEAAADGIKVRTGTLNRPVLLFVAAGPHTRTTEGGHRADGESHLSPPVASVALLRSAAPPRDTMRRQPPQAKRRRSEPQNDRQRNQEVPQLLEKIVNFFGSVKREVGRFYKVANLFRKPFTTNTPVRFSPSQLPINIRNELLIKEAADWVLNRSVNARYRIPFI